MISKVSITEEIRNFLKEKQFSEWKKLLEIYIQKINDQSLNQKERNFWVIKLYSQYLQFIEIFSINIFVITENRLFENLFMGNVELKAKIDKQLGSNEYIDYLVKKWIFGIKNRETINHLEEKENFYKRLIKEVVKDYVNDQDLLNAYKHGFRLESKGYINVKMVIDNNPGKTFPIDNYNSSIHYWSKGKKEEKHIIFENRLLFNWERIEQKFILIDNILENILKVFFSNDKKVNLTHLYIDDPIEFNKHFGTMRMKTPIFTKSETNNKQVSRDIVIE